MGYREGFFEGKSKSLQKGFDDGYALHTRLHIICSFCEQIPELIESAEQSKVQITTFSLEHSQYLLRINTCLSTLINRINQKIRSSVVLPDQAKPEQVQNKSVMSSDLAPYPLDVDGTPLVLPGLWNLLIALWKHLSK